ncbi:MAG TPA: glycosyltransferase family 2 protein [bacterium]|nr:glycosyltransferase family 2 protein [bacterium]
MKLSIIIPHYGDWQLLRRCLESYAATAAGPDVECVVVDNASPDAAAGDALCRAYPRTRLLRQEENTGFGRACNCGAAAAAGEWLLVLNNDTVLEPGWLAAFADGSARWPETAAFAALMLYPERATIENAGLLLARTGLVYANRRGELVTNAADGEEIFAPCGGGMFIRRDVFLTMGGFDERYFAYSEDAELGWRLQRAGRRTRVLTGVRIRHWHGSTARTLPAFARARMITENRLRTWLLHWPAGMILRNAGWLLLAESALLLQTLLRERTLGGAAGWLTVLRNMPAWRREYRRQAAAVQQFQPERWLCRHWRPERYR